MKKLTTITAALLLMLSISAFTNAGDEVSIKIKTEFSKNFTSASNVTWMQKDDSYIASFKMDDKEFAASYDNDGYLLSVSRYISLSQLPLNVTMSINKNYEGYDLDPSVIELSSEGSTNYFINAENGKYKVKLKSDAAGNLTTESRTKKK